MGKLQLSKWWGLYALVPLMIALMVIDVDAAMSQTWHLILLAGIVCTSARWRSLGLTETLGWSSAAAKVATLPYRRRMSPRRLYTGVADEWESVPIRHSGMDD